MGYLYDAAQWSIMPGRRPSVDGIDVDGIRTYLREQPVRFALLFGSRAREEDDDRSDVDVTLAFEERLDRMERFRRRNRIDAVLQSYAPVSVDVSDFETLPQPVARSALEEGLLLLGDEAALREAKRSTEADGETVPQDRHDTREVLDRLASGDV